MELEKIVNEEKLSEFSEESKKFYLSLIRNDDLMLVRSPTRLAVGKIFSKEQIPSILSKIDQAGFCEGVEINNIISN